MKEYKRKRRSTDPVQELSAGQYNFEYILNPIGEQQRLKEENEAENQIQLQKSSLPEAQEQPLPRAQVPDVPAEQPNGHTSFSTTQFVALAALVAIIAAAIIYALMR